MNTNAVLLSPCAAWLSPPRWSAPPGVAANPAEPPARRGRVRVAAAADLNAALGRRDRALRRRARRRRQRCRTDRRETSTRSCSNRAPFDLFLSADVTYPNQLAARGLTLPQSEFTYAIGRLVAVGAARRRRSMSKHDGLQSLTQASIAHIAIANPEHAPYGRAAVAAMQAAGVYDARAAEAGARRERRAGDAVRPERRCGRRHSSRCRSRSRRP